MLYVNGARRQGGTIVLFPRLIHSLHCLVGFHLQNIRPKRKFLRVARQWQQSIKPSTGSGLIAQAASSKAGRAVGTISSSTAKQGQKIKKEFSALWLRLRDQPSCRSPNQEYHLIVQKEGQIVAQNLLAWTWTRDQLEVRTQTWPSCSFVGSPHLRHKFFLIVGNRIKKVVSVLGAQRTG